MLPVEAELGSHRPRSSFLRLSMGPPNKRSEDYGMVGAWVRRSIAFAPPSASAIPRPCLSFGKPRELTARRDAAGR